MPNIIQPEQLQLYPQLIYNEILNIYMRYKNILFKLSPLEWQEAQEALKAEVPSDAAGEQNREPQSAAGQGE